MKKTYTATFKAQAVWECFKETKTLNQLASEYGVATTVLREWKLAAVKGLADVFEKRDSVTEVCQQYLCNSPETFPDQPPYASWVQCRRSTPYPATEGPTSEPDPGPPRRLHKRLSCGRSWLYARLVGQRTRC